MFDLIFLDYFIKTYFWLFYYYFTLFFINRNYNVNKLLDLILTTSKQTYNTNDRSKFILTIIRWENDLK